MSARAARAWAGNLIVIVVLLMTSAWPQHKITAEERERAQAMLRQVDSEVRKHYYDPTFHGIDWGSKVQEFKQKIDRVDSSNMAFSEVAALLDSLNDSHTFFLPPSHALHHDYGWKTQLIGNHCYVVRVRSGSDAEKKGVKPGDEVLFLNGYAPTKENFWKMNYVYEVLDPQHEMRLDLRDRAGNKRTVRTVTKFSGSTRIKDLTGETGGNQDSWNLIREEENREREGRIRTVEMGDELMIVKLPSFLFSDPRIGSMVGEARKHKSLILDLRGNGGGSIDTLEALIGNMFDKDIKIGDRVGRGDHKIVVAKARGHRFEGKLVVLVDRKSASASELFARVIQIEKRGVTMGDWSAGSVMEARRYSYEYGYGTVVFYGASITDADIIMSDGKSLEHGGVKPDEIVLPTADDIGEGRDPLLAHAAETLGVKLSPEAAGKFFPYEWPTEE